MAEEERSRKVLRECKGRAERSQGFVGQHGYNLRHQRQSPWVLRQGSFLERPGAVPKGEHGLPCSLSSWVGGGKPSTQSWSPHCSHDSALIPYEE